MKTSYREWLMEGREKKTLRFCLNGNMSLLLQVYFITNWKSKCQCLTLIHFYNETKLILNIQILFWSHRKIMQIPTRLLSVLKLSSELLQYEGWSWLLRWMPQPSLRWLNAYPPEAAALERKTSPMEMSILLI